MRKGGRVGEANVFGVRATRHGFLLTHVLQANFPCPLHEWHPRECHIELACWKSQWMANGKTAFLLLLVSYIVTSTRLTVMW